MKVKGIDMGRTENVSSSPSVTSDRRLRSSFRSRRQSEAGASLILALVFVVSISLRTQAIAEICRNIEQAMARRN